MAKALQAKLLRALEAGEVRRIGENDSRARRRPLRRRDQRRSPGRRRRPGEFRSDLFYRLNVHRIHLPPLRERRGDIPLLVEHFLERFGAGAGVDGVRAGGAGAARRYDYPGNVRQLEHIIQRAVAVARGSSSSSPTICPRNSSPSPPRPGAAEGTVAAARERAEREMIVATLARNHGEIAAAARELQVSRTTMWRLMKKHRHRD